MGRDPYIEYLSEDIKAKAYYSSGGEAAWPRQETLTVIISLCNFEYAVLGGEIWLPTLPGPTIPAPYIYTWEVSPRQRNESWRDFVNRAANESKRYVSEFVWDPADKANARAIPFFNLTVASKSEYEECSR
jgi:hypothetical protein